MQYDKAHETNAEIAKLRVETPRLREDNEKLGLDNDRLRLENQMLRDEIARLKNLPSRPPFRSSGMEKATQPAKAETLGKGPGRGAKRDRSRVTREVTLKADVPEGSRFKGCRTILVRELVLASEAGALQAGTLDHARGQVDHCAPASRYHRRFRAWLAALLPGHACRRPGDNRATDVDPERDRR